MLSKVGKGSGLRLICCDCRLPSGRAAPLSRSTEIGTALLITLFGVTAAALMTLIDQGTPTLRDSQWLNFDDREAQATPLRRLARLRSGLSRAD
jgi:hypothetical protein